MKVIICGAGRVGTGIAEKLAEEQNDVSVIDSSPDLISGLRDTLDVRGIVGHGAHPDVLMQANASEADMLIAVTLHDEVNMVACQVAHSLFNVPTKVARVRAQSYLQPHWQNLFSRENMPIDVVISPEIEVGENVLRRLALPGAVEILRFADQKVMMLGILLEAGCPVANIPLKQFSYLFPDLEAMVVGVYRQETVLVPKNQDSLQIGDIAYVVLQSMQAERVLQIFGHEETQASRVIIAGGGHIGFFVAENLEKQSSGFRIKMIEASRERALVVADHLQRTVVLHGSALDQDILQEAGIQETDTLLALTNDDEVNILSCVMAKKMGCRRNLALLNNATYPSLVRSLGIDACLDPRSVTVSRILQYIRRGRIRSVYSLQNGQAEIIEAEALETSPLVGRPLSELHLPEGLRVGAVLRHGLMIVPDGKTCIQTSDRVVIFSLAAHVKQVERLFRVSLEFF